MLLHVDKQLGNNFWIIAASTYLFSCNHSRDYASCCITIIEIVILLSSREREVNCKRGEREFTLLSDVHSLFLVSPLLALIG